MSSVNSTGHSLLRIATVGALALILPGVVLGREEGTKTKPANIVFIQTDSWDGVREAASPWTDEDERLIDAWLKGP